MPIEFCPECGIPLKKSEFERELVCSKCNFRKPLTDISSKEKIPKQIEKGKGAVENKNFLANYNHVCKKCGHDKVEIIDLGIFISDEDNLILLKCGKCGWSERIGKKVS